jgi:hypothetical protein
MTAGARGFGAGGGIAGARGFGAGGGIAAASAAIFAASSFPASFSAMNIA